MITVGTLLANRYRLVNRVAAGGMGMVWEGRDELLQRRVAVKQVIIHPGLGDDEVRLARERVIREARITARLHHPHAVALFDVVEEDGQPFLVMQFVPSKSLKDLLRERGSLGPGVVSRIGFDIASALAAAHEAGIVHRDVKPGNVLITEEGSAKITDFGISYSVGDATLTAVGMVTGTPAYLAPEVARGNKSDFPADVFSLGATLYAALEGRPPFGADDNPMATLHRAASGEIDPPQKSGPMTPLLLRMMAPEPRNRPTMQNVVSALTRGPVSGPGAPNMTALGPPVGGREKSGRRSRRKEKRATVALAAPAVSPVPTPPPAATDTGPPSAVPESRPSSAVPTPPPPQAPESRPQQAGRDSRNAPRVPDSHPAPAGGEAPSAPAAPASLWKPGRDSTPGPVAREPDRRPPGRAPAVGAVAPAPGGAPDDSRVRVRRVVAIVGVLAVVAAAVVIGFLLFRSTDEGQTAVGNATTVDAPATGTAAATGTVSRAATSSPASPTPSPTTTESAAAGADGIASPAALTAAVTEYYALMPADLDAGWTHLTPAFQTNIAQSREYYSTFWGSVDSVAVSNVSASGPNTVDATVTYTFKDGRVSVESTRYELVDDGGTLKIDDSTVLSSRSG